MQSLVIVLFKAILQSIPTHQPPPPPAPPPPQNTFVDEDGKGLLSSVEDALSDPVPLTLCVQTK